MKKFIYGFIGALLVAIYPVVFLYAHNAAELVLGQITFSLILMSAGALLIFGAVYLVTKNTFKASLLSMLLACLFANYGLVYEVSAFVIPAAKHWHVLPASVFICLHVIYFILKSKNELLLKNVVTTVTLVMAVLVCFNTITLAKVEFSKYSLKKAQAGVEIDVEAGNKDYPDVYHIILDEYASNDTIRDVYGYDNSEFLNFLEDKGFYIADKSRSRYHSTLYAMPSVLNMEYVTSPISMEQFVLNIRNIMPVEQLIDKFNNNEVFKFFKNKNYKTIGIENLSEPYQGIHLNNIDEYYILKDENTQSNDFNTLFLDKTLVAPIIPGNPLLAVAFQNRANSVKGAFYRLLSQSNTSIKQPKYVYSHILCPHAPFIFNSSGNIIAGNEENWSNKKYYLDQYIYVTNQVEQIISSILENSTKNTIIILQSDHGPRFNKDGQMLLELDISTEHHFKVFNAIRVSADLQQKLYNNISPVNTYRFIFNHYFGTNFEMLEDE